ncbi:MAG TPA: GNAT family N-acetyltransferase, partial [Candidatus Edwardsbacteria bacterium]|nr:GNAT family N-acetyltransferase [Candidatus Edwardsbacteria bacterium]
MIVELGQRPELFEDAVEFFWDKFGTRDNALFYRDCMEHSVGIKQPLPRFYLALEGGAIAGCYALLLNDLISRQDLYPWLACLFVAPELRGRGLGAKLLAHGAAECRAKGFASVYLCTDLEGYYEKHGWEFMTHAYMTWGAETKVYTRTTRP